jgi:hypothetical protein
MDRSMQVKGRSVDVVRDRPVAKPASGADAPARALPAPRARDGRVSLGLAKDIRFDYFNVCNIPARLGRMSEDPWPRSTSQAVTNAMFKRIGSQTSRA